jgi:hypothetical protein
MFIMESSPGKAADVDDSYLLPGPFPSSSIQERTSCSVAWSELFPASLARRGTKAYRTYFQQIRLRGPKAYRTIQADPVRKVLHAL